VELVRGVGTALTLAGVFLVAPSGTVHAVRSSWAWLRRAPRRAREKLASTWLGKLPLVGPWLRASTFRLTGVSGSVMGNFSASGSVSVVTAWLPDTEPVHARVTQLQQKLDDVRAELDALRADHYAKLTELRAELESRAERLSAQVEELQRRLTQAEAEAAVVDANALPWVFGGVLLQSWPSVLSWLPVWLLWPVLLGLCVLAAWQTVGAVRRELERTRLTEPGAMS
jgi:multidrug efflux pump subunit AcrA (membrane-fusion protein)